MQTNRRNYVFNDADDRIKEILDAPAGAYEELNAIPDRSRLTYTNGFYVNCTAVFIDIRDSSKLTASHTTPVLGKIYRAFISECIGVLNSFDECKEIFLAGDCVSGIFNTPFKADIDWAFVAAGALNTLITHLNWRLEQKGYVTIRCGVGIAYGRALMLKSGFSGSGLNDVVWMGNVVNEASNLCHHGNKNGRMPVQVSPSVQTNLSDEFKGLLHPVFENPLMPPSSYESDLVHLAMRDWLQAKMRTTSLNQMLQGAAAPYFGLPSFFQPPTNQ